MNTFKKIFLQLLLIIGLIVYSAQKSTLKAKDITKEYCESDLNRYSFILQCELNGSLSQSMFRNLIIKSNDYEPEIKCEFPEISDTKGNYETIEIPCHIKNFQNGYLSFRFEAESDELELNNFNDKYFYLYIQCQQTITLVFGDIIDQECEQHKFYTNYFYKITILNETIPKDIYENFNLQPKIVKNQNDSDDDIYVSCYLYTNDNDYFICTIDFDRKLEATIYYEKDYIFEKETSKYKIIVKNQNRDLYVNQNINCFFESEVDFLNILKGNCKNGVFFFSIDFSSFGDNDNNENNENKEVYSKLLFEFKAKVDSKIYKNYCYLDNKNEDNKYDISKYKLNCAITSFDFEENYTYHKLFSGFYLFNYYIKELVYNEIYCYTSQNYITPFYYYYDICSNNNTFKILAVTNFNNDIFNVVINGTIEIPIISPFESIAICKLSSLQLEPYIEFNCEINGSKIIDYNNIFFGNVTTESYIENMEPIKFGGFEGIKNFGKYCSDKGSKCTQLIEKDYGINSMNKNNPKVYEYSFCLTSDDNSIFNKDNYNILFNNNSIVNCSIKNTDIVRDNSTESKVKCLLDNEILDEYPLLKNFNPINFTFYNDIFKNINEFAKYFQDIIEIDSNSIIKVNKVEYYHCLDNNSILLKLKGNFTMSNRYNSYIEYYFGGFKYMLYPFFMDYVFNSILSDNSMNITIFDYDNNYHSSIVDIECVINGDFSHENNIIIKNGFYYKVFFNNFTIIWNNKTLLENIKCDNNDRLIFYDFNNINLKSFRIISYSLYDFDFYDNNGRITDYLLLNVKINGIMAEEKAICSISSLSHYNSIIIDINLYCEMNGINIEFNDIITLEECDETIIKTLDGIELKIEGLDKFYYISKYESSKDKAISIYYNNDKNKDGEFCNQYGFFFNLTYYLDNPLENNDDITQYSINNLINPINNEIIEGNCSFIKNDDYYYNKYNLFCQIYSDLLGVPYLIINNNYLDKENNNLPNITISPYSSYTSVNQPIINFEHSLSCAKKIIFTINEIKDKNCIDGTYIFKMYGTLSKYIEYNINNITIRDMIENNIQIFCNNLSYHTIIEDTYYYSFDCYIINDISSDYFNITFLDTPPSSNIISISYSQSFKNNKMIHFNFKCFNEDRSQTPDDEFDSFSRLIDFFNGESSSNDKNKYIYKLMVQKDNKYKNKKLEEYYNKYMGNFFLLYIIEDLGLSFCDLKDKNITNTLILRCYGNYDYYKNLEKIGITKDNCLNSFNIYGDSSNGINITFLGFINQNINENDENDEEHPIFEVDYISKGCKNGQYIFNISGQIYGKSEEINTLVPKEVEIALYNNLYAMCKVFKYINDKDTDLELNCHLFPNKEIINQDILFNVSSLKEDDIIYSGLIDYITTENEIIELDVSCGIVDQEYNDTLTNSSLYTDDIDTDDFQKSILEAQGIGNSFCESELDRFSFEIIAHLKGILSKSMLENYSIQVNSFNNLTIICEFPEINDNNYDDYISIPCHIDNIENEMLSFSFKGESDTLLLFNFNENVLGLYIYCTKYTIINLGEITEQECKQNNYNYAYNIKILNKNLPKSLYLNDINLKPYGLNDDDYIYCDLINDDNNYYFRCTIKFHRKLKVDELYYEKNYKYLTLANNSNIFIKNNGENLYIGHNIICYKKQVNILNILKGDCRNGAFFFSIDFNHFNDKEEEEVYDIKSKKQRQKLVQK